MGMTATQFTRTNAIATRMRIGDYELTRSLPIVQAGILEFEATHIVLPRKAHVRLARGGHEAAAQLLIKEACILEALRDPGVPRIYECGLREGRPWIASELLDGPSLDEAIRGRAMSPAEMFAIVRDVAEVLHHAHLRGVAHGRLAPASIVRHEGGLCVTGWSATAVDAREDVAALGKILALALAPPMSRTVMQLVDRMTSDNVFTQLSAAEVRAEAIRLLEDDIVETVEIEIEQVTELDAEIDP
jgi:tRNA A-37 threonylcarbamoyl transferase component Bud32